MCYLSARFHYCPYRKNLQGIALSQIAEQLCLFSNLKCSLHPKPACQRLFLNYRNPCRKQSNFLLDSTKSFYITALNSDYTFWMHTLEQN